MGRGGHNKKSAHLHLIQGTLRADHIAANRLTPRPIVPPPPRGLDRRARSLWLRLAPILQPLGLLTELDMMAFEVLCHAHSRMELAEGRLRAIERRRRSVTVADLTVIRRAERSVEQAAQSFRLLAAEFGMTPAARGRLDIVAPIGDGGDEGFEEFLERGTPT